MSNKLYFGDNLQVMKNEIDSNSVDLIYLDPPFNSQRNYNIFFDSGKNKRIDNTQIVAFEDTWFWNDNTTRELDTLQRSENANVISLITTLLNTYGRNDLMAYMVMMAVRLIEIERILKQTGTLYLHCDTNVSHYLKILLDTIFGPTNFRNEISWLRSQPKSHASKNLSKCRDIILRYTKSDNYTFNKLYGKYDENYLTKFYKYTDKDGRRYRIGDLTNINKNRPNLTYEFLGVTRVWVWTKERMRKAYDEGLIVQAKPGGVPGVKKYLDERLGMPITDNWADIEHLHSTNAEYFGYPTQKPLALLGRIISLSSNKGDVVMDPFCGCGTAIDAAERLGRSWIGIDMSHLSISLVQKRLRDSCGGAKWSLFGLPTDLRSAMDLASRDTAQFQYWALDLVKAKPSQGKKTKATDRAIDGIIYFVDDAQQTPMTYKSIIVSVKSAIDLSVSMIGELKEALDNDAAEMAYLITLYQPNKAMVEEAAGSGLYHSPDGNAYPKIQILSIENLLKGRQPTQPKDLLSGAATFKKSKPILSDTSRKASLF